MMASPSRKVFSVCGERSGDTILRRVRGQQSALLEFLPGVWTPSSEGEEVLFDGPRELGVMGAGLDLLRCLPRAWMRLRQTTAAVARSRPDVLLTVDSKGFCLRLQRAVAAATAGTKQVHVCAPSIWAFHKGLDRARGLGHLDSLCTVLPFEPYFWRLSGRKTEVRFVGYFAVEALLDELGVPEAKHVDAADLTYEPENHHVDGSRQFILPHEVEWRKPGGHIPRLTELQKRQRKISMYRKYFLNEPNLNESDPLLILAPGSRTSVVKTALPLMDKVLAEMIRRHPKRNIRVALICTDDSEVQRLLHGVCASKYSNFSKINTKIIPDSEKNVLMGAGDVAFAVSGTVVTELLLFGVPTIVFYNSGGWATEAFARQTARIDHVTVCNIMSGKEIVPEFLFSECKDTSLICNGIESLLFDPSASRTMMDETSRWMDHLVLWHEGKPVRPSRAVVQILQNLKGIQ